MELTADSDKLPYVTKRLKEFYLNGSSIIKDFNSQGFVDVSKKRFVAFPFVRMNRHLSYFPLFSMQMYTDRSFHYPFYKAIEAYIKYANTTKNPVYLYKFAYKGSLSYSRLFTGTDRDFGVGHIDDLIYLFKTPAVFREFATGSDAAQLIRALVGTYVQFAKHG